MEKGCVEIMVKFSKNISVTDRHKIILKKLCQHLI